MNPGWCTASSPGALIKNNKQAGGHSVDDTASRAAMRYELSAGLAFGGLEDQIIDSLLEPWLKASVFGANDPVGIDYENERDGLNAEARLYLVVTTGTPVPVPPGDTVFGYRSSHCALVMVEGDAEQREWLPLESL